MNLYDLDPEKQSSNLVKHGISFDQAFKAVTDPNNITFYDRTNSGFNKYGIWEDRWRGYREGWQADSIRILYCEK